MRGMCACGICLMIANTQHVASMESSQLVNAAEKTIRLWLLPARFDFLEADDGREFYMVNLIATYREPIAMPSTPRS